MSDARTPTVPGDEDGYVPASGDAEYIGEPSWSVTDPATSSAERQRALAAEVAEATPELEDDSDDSDDSVATATLPDPPPPPPKKKR